MWEQYIVITIVYWSVTLFFGYQNIEIEADVDKEE